MFSFIVTVVAQVNYQQFWPNQSVRAKRQRKGRHRKNSRRVTQKNADGGEAERRKSFMFCDILHDTIKQALNGKIPGKDQLKAKSVEDEVKVTKMVIILIKSEAQKLSQLRLKGEDGAEGLQRLVLIRKFAAHAVRFYCRQ